MIRFVAGKRKVTTNDIAQVLSLSYERVPVRQAQGKVLYAHAACFAALLSSYQRVIPRTIHLLTKPDITPAHMDELRFLFPEVTFDYQKYFSQWREGNIFVSFEIDEPVEDWNAGYVITMRCEEDTPSYIMYRALTMARFLTDDVREAMHDTKYVLNNAYVEEKSASLEELTLRDILRNAYFFSYIVAHMPVDRAISYLDIVRQSAYLRSREEQGSYLTTQNRLLCMYFAGEANYQLVRERIPEQNIPVWKKTRVYSAQIRVEDVTKRVALLIDSYMEGIR